MDDSWEPSPEAVFLQLLLAAGYISASDLNVRIAEVNRKFPEHNRRSLEDIQAEANLVFSAIGMDLVQTREDFENGELYYCVVSREDLPSFLNRIVMQQSHALQLKGILAKMFENSRCEGIYVDGLLSSVFPAKHEIVAKLLEDKRFVKLDNNNVFLSTRLLHEIEGYLVNEYGGSTLLKCIGCNQWLLKGKLCANANCKARLHERCYDAYFNSRRLPKGICPECSGHETL